MTRSVRCRSMSLMNVSVASSSYSPNSRPSPCRIRSKPRRYSMLSERAATAATTARTGRARPTLEPQKSVVSYHRPSITSCRRAACAQRNPTSGDRRTHRRPVSRALAPRVCAHLRTPRCELPFDAGREPLAAIRARGVGLFEGHARHRDVARRGGERRSPADRALDDRAARSVRDACAIQRHRVLVSIEAIGRHEDRRAVRGGLRSVSRARERREDRGVRAMRVFSSEVGRFRSRRRARARGSVGQSQMSSRNPWVMNTSPRGDS